MATQITDKRSIRTRAEDDAYRQGEDMAAQAIAQRSEMMQPQIQPDSIPAPAQQIPGQLPQTTGKTIATQLPAPMPMTRKIEQADLLRAERILKEYKDGKARLEASIISCQQWWKMRNWQQINRERGTQGSQPRKTNTGWLHNCIVGKHADACDSYPEPVVLPRMMDDKEEAKRLSDILPVVLHINEFEETWSKAAYQKITEGTGAYGIFWDKSKTNGLGDIAITRINILNFFWEPGIQNIQDSQNLFLVNLIDNAILNAEYPQLKDQQKGSSLTIAEYQYDDYVKKDNKSLVIDWYYKRKSPDGREVLHYVKFTGMTVLYATEEDPALAERGLYDDGKYPFVLDPLFPIEGSPCGYGWIHVGRDAQTDLDTLNQAMITNATVSATPRYFCRKDGGVNEEEFLDLSKPLVHANGNLGNDTLQPVQVATMNGNILNMLQLKEDELKFIMANMDVNNGGVPTGVTAASAIAALKEDSGRASKDSTRGSYRAYREIIFMVIERIRQFYDLPRQFRILGPRGEEQFVEYTNAGLQNIPITAGPWGEQGYRTPVFDIEVHAQRETSYTKIAQNELAIQFYQLGFFNPGQADEALMALDMMEFKGKEEMQQKIQQNGTLYDMLLGLCQVAQGMAGELGDQIAIQQIQDIMLQAGSGAPVGNAAQALPRAPIQQSRQDASDAGKTADANPYVRKARQQAQDASRVN